MGINPKTRFITMDYETTYSADYTLSKLTTSEYVRDHRFEAIGVAISEDFGFPYWLHGPEEVRRVINELGLDRPDTTTIYHHAFFDASITEWRMGVQHNRVLCTMMGSRMHLVPFTQQNRMSLAKLAELCTVGPKGGYVVAAKGKRYHDFSTQELCDYGDYCIRDVEVTNELAKKMLSDLPASELEELWLTVRKFIRPKLRLNRKVLQEHLAAERARKAKLLAAAGIDDAGQLRSNDKFAELLLMCGLDPPTKVSPTTGKQTYAFAKTDPEFKALLTNEDNPDVQALCAARVGHKSTLEESRAERFIRQADLGTPFAVPILYWGARTGRFSGFDSLNVQNLAKKGNLRRSMEAPPGYKVVAGDLSQIEARMTAWLAGEEGLLELFRNPDIDPYRQFGADNIYTEKRPEELTDRERHVSKMSVLALGFGMGPDKFCSALASSPWMPVKLSLKESRRVVYAYRNANKNIGRLWDTAGDRWLPTLMHKDRQPIRHGPLFIAPGFIGLPNGAVLRYPDTRLSFGPKLRGTRTSDVVYGAGGVEHRIYGAKLVENCCTQDTEVLTSTGWKRIIDVCLKDRIWDGEEWVNHRGVVYQGRKEVIQVNGIGLTPEHKILTTKGWYGALESEGSDWAEVRLPNSYQAGGDFQRRHEAVASPLQMRSRMGYTNPKVDRLSYPNDRLSPLFSGGYQQDARYVQAPSLCRMALYASSLPPIDASSMEELRRQGHQGLRQVAEFIPEFLGGHGAYLSEGADYRPDGQRWGLHPEQLSMGFATSQQPKQEMQSGGRRSSTQSNYRNQQIDVVLPQEKGNPVAVYDILSVGPRHRFTVRDRHGKARIIHNCVQALARIVMTRAELYLADRGHYAVLSLHDEPVYVVPDEWVERFKRALQLTLTRPVSWAPGLPLGAEVTCGQNYGEQA